jgi:hypothetical protein
MGLHRNYHRSPLKVIGDHLRRAGDQSTLDCAIVYPGSAQVSSNALEATAV